MTRIRHVGGKIIETTGGKEISYAKESIVFNTVKKISFTANDGTFFGEPKDPPENIFSKKIKEIYWTYGHTKLFDKSRFYVDMNLIVKTINYKEGESVEVCIKSKDEQPLTDNQDQIILTGLVNKDNMVVFENVLKDYSLNLMEEERFIE